jgi:hypothetical protein
VYLLASISTIDGTDFLNDRLHKSSKDKHFSVLNTGISRNLILKDGSEVGLIVAMQEKPFIS